MTHFTVLVIGNDIENKLAPYDENIEVEPYIEMPKEEVMAEYKKVMKKASDPPRVSGIDYNKYKDGMILSEFAAQRYGQEVDNEGNLLTTYNPKSKWDWYIIGGRWEGMLITKSGTKTNRAPKGVLDIDIKTFFTIAVITEDGIWHEVGEVGLFGCGSETNEEMEEWKKTYWDNFLKELFPNILLTIVDCHI